MDGKIGDGRLGQIELKAIPLPATIEADVESRFGSGIKNFGSNRVLADDPGEVSVLDSCVDWCPMGPIISRD